MAKVIRRKDGLHNMKPLVITNKQARQLAQVIYPDIKEYIQRNREDFEEYLKQLGKEEGKEVGRVPK